MWESKIGTYGVVLQKWAFHLPVVLGGDFIQECIKITDECET